MTAETVHPDGCMCDACIEARVGQARERLERVAAELPSSKERVLIEEARKLLCDAPLGAHTPDTPEDAANCDVCAWVDRLQAWHDKLEALPVETPGKPAEPYRGCDVWRIGGRLFVDLEQLLEIDRAEVKTSAGHRPDVFGDCTNPECNEVPRPAPTAREVYASAHGEDAADKAFGANEPDPHS